MQCPNCHKEVPPGNLYCPECLTEIPWVKEYDTVEMRQKKQEDQKQGESVPETPTRRPRTWIIPLLILLCVIFAGAAGLFSYYMYRKSQTFDALLEKARKEKDQRKCEQMEEQGEAADVSN